MKNTKIYAQVLVALMFMHTGSIIFASEIPVPTSGLTGRQKIGLWGTITLVGFGIGYHFNQERDKERRLKDIRRDAGLASRSPEAALLDQISGQTVHRHIYCVGNPGQFAYIHDIVRNQNKFLDVVCSSVLDDQVITYRVVRHAGIEQFERIRGYHPPTIAVDRTRLLEDVVLVAARAEELFLSVWLQDIERLFPGMRKKVMKQFTKVCGHMGVDPLTALDAPSREVEIEIDERMIEELCEPKQDHEPWYTPVQRFFSPKTKMHAQQLCWDLFKTTKRLAAIKKVVLARLRSAGANPVHTALSALQEHVRAALQESLVRWQTQNLPHQGATHLQNERNVPRNQNEVIDTHQIIALKNIFGDLNLQVDRAQAGISQERATWDSIQLDYHDCTATLKTIGTLLNRLVVSLDAQDAPTVGKCNVVLRDAHGCFVLMLYALDGLLRRSIVVAVPDRARREERTGAAMVML